MFEMNFFAFVCVDGFSTNTLAHQLYYESCECVRLLSYDATAEMSRIQCAERAMEKDRNVVIVCEYVFVCALETVVPDANHTYIHKEKETLRQTYVLKIFLVCLDIIQLIANGIPSM